MNRRAFTLVEVLISLAMFALAAISLGAAYTNVVLSRQALKVDDVAVDDLARARAALLETVNYDDVATGGEINLPGDRVATWKGEIEPTSVSDLFSVTLTVEIQNADGTDAAPLTETRLLLRPTWSVPADRQKIRDAAKPSSAGPSLRSNLSARSTRTTARATAGPTRGRAPTTRRARNSCPCSKGCRSSCSGPRSTAPSCSADRPWSRPSPGCASTRTGRATACASKSGATRRAASRPSTP